MQVGGCGVPASAPSVATHKTGPMMTAINNSTVATQTSMVATDRSATTSITTISGMRLTEKGEQSVKKAPLKMFYISD